MSPNRSVSAALLAGVVALGLLVAKCEPTPLDATQLDENPEYDVQTELNFADFAGGCAADSFMCSQSEGCCKLGQECCELDCCQVGFRCVDEGAFNSKICVAELPTPTPTVDPNPTPTAPPGEPVPTPTPGTPTPSPSVAPSVPAVPAGCEGNPVIRLNSGSIQAAVDAAPDGAMIVVGPGLYNESVGINRRVTIVGDPSQAAIVSGTFNIAGPNVCIVDMAVTGLIFLQPTTTGCTIHHNDVGGCIPNQGTGNTRTANVCQALPGTGCTSSPVPCND